MLNDFPTFQIAPLSAICLASLVTNTFCAWRWGIKPYLPTWRSHQLPGWRLFIGGVFGRMTVLAVIMLELESLSVWLEKGFDPGIQLAFDQAIRISCGGLGAAVFLRNYSSRIKDASWKLLGILFFGSYLLVGTAVLLLKLHFEQ